MKNNTNSHFTRNAITGMLLVVATFAFAIANGAQHSDYGFANLVVVALGAASVVFLSKAVKSNNDSDHLGEL